MTKEEKKKLEDTAAALRETADKAHNAAAADPEDQTLQDAAEKAEENAAAALTEAETAVVDADEEEEEPADEDDIDFEKEAEALKVDPEQPAKPKAPLTELEKAERALFFNAKKVTELGGDPTKVVKPVPDAPLPRNEDAEDDKRFVTQDDLAKRDLTKELRALAKSDAELKVLEFHAEHSIKLTGDPAKDAENAYFIAHKGKIKRSFEEIRRATFARPAPGTPPGRKAPVRPATAVITAEERATFTRRGFKPQADGTWAGKHNIMRLVPGRGWVTEPKKK